MGNRRSEIAATTPAAASGTAQAAGSACSAKDLGGSDETPGDLQKKQPNGQLHPRINAFGKARAATSRRWSRPRQTKTTPISSAPAAISSEPNPFAIAIAPKAFSGCTGIGNP